MYGVPGLELDPAALGADGLGAELDPDGRLVHDPEAQVDELDEQAAFANAGVADDELQDE